MPESSIANADDAAGNGDGCHIITPEESIITDFDNIVVLAIIGYFGWDNNRAGIIFASRCIWLVCHGNFRSRYENIVDAVYSKVIIISPCECADCKEQHGCEKPQ